MCESEFKCDGGPKQVWISTFGCVFLKSHKQFGNSTLVGGTMEIPVYRARKGLSTCKNLHTIVHQGMPEDEVEILF